MTIYDLPMGLGNMGYTAFISGERRPTFVWNRETILGNNGHSVENRETSIFISR